MSNKILKSIPIILMAACMIGCSDDQMSGTTAIPDTTGEISTGMEMESSSGDSMEESSGSSSTSEIPTVPPAEEYFPCNVAAGKEPCAEGLACIFPIKLFVMDVLGNLIDQRMNLCGEVCHQQSDCGRGEVCLQGFCLEKCEVADQECEYDGGKGTCRFMQFAGISDMGFFCWVK